MEKKLFQFLIFILYKLSNILKSNTPNKFKQDFINQNKVMSDKKKVEKGLNQCVVYTLTQTFTFTQTCIYSNLCLFSTQHSLHVAISV